MKKIGENGSLGSRGQPLMFHFIKKKRESSFGSTTPGSQSRVQKAGHGDDARFLRSWEIEGENLQSWTIGTTVKSGEATHCGSTRGRDARGGAGAPCCCCSSSSRSRLRPPVYPIPPVGRSKNLTAACCAHLSVGNGMGPGAPHGRPAPHVFIRQSNDGSDGMSFVFALQQPALELSWKAWRERVERLGDCESLTIRP